MLISVNWLRDLVKVDASAQEIADRLSVSGLEVEHLDAWETVKGGLKGFVIGHVMACEKHPNADKLSITKVDIGLGELQPIVCGAPNVTAGQKVVVATVGTEVTVPGKGSFTIGEAKIRGEISRGMICAEDEMGIGTSHDGILVLPHEAPVGKPAAEYFKVVSDEVLEIGLTANRGDAASHLGVARDVAALFGTHVVKPQPDVALPATGNWNLVIENPDICQRYIGLEVKNVKTLPSPDWMQNRLRAIGIEPKNILVDATNYVLHELGQPIHAFDADKLQGNAIGVRLAVAGEKFTTLDKIERTCKGGELVIADASGPIAFAGVMGGLDAAVTENTSRILIESAHFHAGLVRKTARAHGLNTDASFRFERGTDVEICELAAARVASLIMQVAGGEVVGKNDHYPSPFVPKKLVLDLNRLNAFAGHEIPAEKAAEILDDLGFGVQAQAQTLEVAIPSWRNDVHETVDLYEEVMRIYGYDQIPMSGKMRATLPVFEGFKLRQIENKGRDFLVANGFFEANNNSLSSAEYYQPEVVANLVEVSNPLSSDLQYMRGSLLPGLLQNAVYNRNRKNENIRFFEFGNVYARAGAGFAETRMLGILAGGAQTEESWEQKQQDMDYFFVKRQVSNLLAAVGFAGNVEAVCSITQVAKRDLKIHDLEGSFWYAEVQWAQVVQQGKPEGFKVIEPPRFPYMRRDLSLVLDKNVGYSQIEKVVNAQKIAILQGNKVFDVFEGKPLPEGKKSVAVAFYLGNPESTLTDADADKAMEQLMAAFEKETGALIRR